MTRFKINTKGILFLCFTFLVSCNPTTKFENSFMDSDLNPLPTLVSVTIASSNSNAAYATVGDTIRLSFTASSLLEEHEASIANAPVSVTHTSGLNYEANYMVTGSEPEGLISFEISFIDTLGKKGENVRSSTDGNTVIVKTTASAPSTIALRSPEASPDMSSSPTFMVSGVESGSTVNIFTDECVTSVGSSVASGTSVDVTSSALELGEYTFYAKQVDFLGNVSECSEVFAIYERVKQPFISVWETTVENESITLPLRSGYVYNMKVNWGDGSPVQEITSWDDLDKTHIYASPGSHTITLYGICTAWYFNNTGDKSKIKSIINLGDVGWTSFEKAFYGANNLTTVFGGNTSSVTDMSFMLAKAIKVEPDTSSWDTSQVESMRSMFYLANLANPDTSQWDTSNVTDMHSMFKFAFAANPDTSDWDTSKVRYFSYIFDSASSANPDTSRWNTSAAIHMASMFANNQIANPDTSGWVTSNVTSMMYMFYDAISATPDTSLWDTSNVTSMRGMFYDASSAAPDTSSWDTSKVTFMDSMFYRAYAANPDFSSWNMTSVEYMQNMFRFVTLPTSSYSNFLIKLANESPYLNVTLDGGNSKYNSAAASARDALVAQGWIIEDGGPE